MLYKSVEFAGETIEAMSVSGRMVLANMSVEMGAKNGYVAPDDKTAEWLAARGAAEYGAVCPDADASYESELEYDVTDLPPMVAKPHTVDNVAPVEEVVGIEIDQVVLGTCTNGRLKDLEDAARILDGRTVASGCRLLVFPASREVWREAMKSGALEVIEGAGGIIMNAGCGPCLGAHEGVLAPGEVCLSTANRNFRGRMGTREAEVYLASPATAAATAVEGRIVDPRGYR
jgi:3-isopropylmalate/(R)-2-methylmalate dehydratase large subunit